MDAIPTELVEDLRQRLTEGRAAFSKAVMTALSQAPSLFPLAPVILYRTLGETLPDDAAAAAPLRAIAQTFAMQDPEALARAGHEDGDALFDAILAGHSGVIFSESEYADSWKRLGGGRAIKLLIPELLSELEVLGQGSKSTTSVEFPLVLSAGERRDYSANTIFRDADWRRKDRDGSLRMSPADATQLGLEDGDNARLVTAVGSAHARIEVNTQDSRLDSLLLLPFMLCARERWSVRRIHWRNSRA